MTFRQAPPILTLQLKRFAYSWKGGRVKVNKPISFEPQLDLTPFMTHGQNRTNQVTYHLQSIIVHAGGAHGGHYYSYVKAANGIWFEMNDERVSQVSLSTVLAANAYVLFYTVTSMKMTERNFLLNKDLQSLPSPPSTPSLPSGRRPKFQFVATPIAVADAQRAAVSHLDTSARKFESSHQIASTEKRNTSRPEPNRNLFEDSSKAEKETGFSPSKVPLLGKATSVVQRLVAKAASALFPTKSNNETASVEHGKRTLVTFDPKKEGPSSSSLSSVLSWNYALDPKDLTRDSIEAQYNRNYLDERAAKIHNEGKRHRPSQWDQELDKGKQKKLRANAKFNESQLRNSPGGLRNQFQEVGQLLNRVNPNEFTQQNEAKKEFQRQHRRQQRRREQQRDRKHGWKARVLR
jgi:hypothetical protein